MKVCSVEHIDGETITTYRDMTPEEEEEYLAEQKLVENNEPLIEMAKSMSTATNLSQMREAAKAFLLATESEEISND